MSEIRLTQYSHGAGCGCKISPADLARILDHSGAPMADPRLLVGHASADDAAVYAATDELAVVSTCDFFMPIVDDPFDFGRIAVTNAMSDVYAMGARPVMAVSILGWPLAQLPAEVAGAVVAGGREACRAEGFSLAGGHSIDAPEPIFGAAVSGLVDPARLKRNDGARAGDLLFLSKPLGVGILTTAEKRGLLRPEHRGLATRWMCRANRLGQAAAQLDGVHAMTDVTGFGLLGHLLEMCRGADLHARLRFEAVPVLDGVNDYIAQGAVPGGTQRNFASYGDSVSALNATQQAVLCDPQTSGGLLIAVAPGYESRLGQLAAELEVDLSPVGEFIPSNSEAPTIEVI